MVTENRQYDLVVFGATGFVGQIVCQHLLEFSALEESFTWAIAGRSPDKLERLVATLGAESANLPRLIADATDESTLRALCQQARVVISTVGPYAIYGEPLVKVCAETGTDYCDLTGEPQWIRRMIETYQASAEQSGAHIVHCCGFDSVPSDMGVYYLQQQAQARLGELCTKIKMRLIDARGGLSGGTAASGVNAVKEASEDATLRENLKDPYFLCPQHPSQIRHPPTMIPVQYDEDFRAWAAPFVMAEVNTRIVLRSNFLRQPPYSVDFQYEEGVLTGDGPLGWLTAQGVKLGWDGLVLAAALPPTRWVLENAILPTSGEGPDASTREKGYYDLRFIGQTAGGRKIRVQVTGDRDPGYGSTAKILAQSGICLAQDVHSFSKPGGFWTPASLLGEALLQRLQQYAGLAFAVMP